MKLKNATTTMLTSGEEQKDRYLNVALGLRAVGKTVIDLPRSLLDIEKLAKEYLKSLGHPDDILKETREYYSFIDKTIEKSSEEVNRILRLNGEDEQSFQQGVFKKLTDGPSKGRRGQFKEHVSDIIEQQAIKKEKIKLAGINSSSSRMRPLHP
jgi:hypothetical protein